MTGDRPHKYRAAPPPLNRPRSLTLGPSKARAGKPLTGWIADFRGLPLQDGGNSTMTRGDAAVPLPFSTHEPPMCMTRVMACLIRSGSLLVI